MAMAVQARYPSQSFTIFQSDVLDHQQQRHQVGTPIGHPLPNMMIGEAGFGLTSNVSGERKRRRDDELGSQSATGVATVSPVLFPGEDIGGLKTSVMSTSGRAPFACYCPHLDQLTCEIDDIIQREYEMKTALVEMTAMRYKRLLSILGQSFQKRLKEKELELELVSKRNQELEENLKQLVAETQIWMSHAKNNEAAVASLQANLEQVLRRSSVEAPSEGFGDNELCPSPAQDEWSSCYNGDEANKRSRASCGGCGPCKSCGVSEACFLVLPCRHLCLCQECARSAGVCPVCDSVKTVAIEVFLS